MAKVINDQNKVRPIKCLEMKPTSPNLTNLVIGRETFNSEIETNLAFRCVSQKFDELSLANG